MKSVEYIVYKALNIVNGKFYIGATKNGLQFRRDSHISDALKGSGFAFHNAIRKYGKENFTWEVIAIAASYEDMMQTEIKLIAKLNPEYNLTKGGQGTLGLKRPKGPASVSGKLTQKRLKEIIHYNKDTGDFTRLVSYHKWAEGKKTGEFDKQSGTIRIVIDGKAYLAHRLAWFYVYGMWTMVGHKNKNKSDNRFDNLFESNRTIVGLNRKTYKTNILGIKGVSKVGDVYEARISFNNNTISLGNFESAELASEAYKAKASELLPLQK